MKSIPVRINDFARKNLADHFSMDGPKGRVIVHERPVGDDGPGTKIVDSSNLIVYRGRNYLLQRAFNKNMTNRSWKDNYISWFAVGKGGAATQTPLNPIAPSLQNCELANHGTIGAGTKYVTVKTLSNVNREYHRFDDGYPRFLNDPDISATDLCEGCTATDPEDGLSYPCDKILIGLVKTTIASNECNGGTTEGSYQDINEAGLYVSPSNLLSYPFQPGDMQIFARVCFSTIRKDSSRELIFSWYIYF